MGDAVHFATNATDLQAVFQDLSNYADLSMNMIKSQIMTNHQLQQILVYSVGLKYVSDYFYLGQLNEIKKYAGQRTLNEECRLRIFEIRILMRIFGTKRDENGEWRRLHNEELHGLYRSPNIARVIKSRRLRWAGHVARMEEGKSAFKILTGGPRRRCEDNIRMDLK